MYYFVHGEKILLRIKHFYPTLGKIFYFVHGVENYTSQSHTLDEFFADGVLFFAYVLFVYTAPIDFRRIYARYPSF